MPKGWNEINQEEMDDKGDFAAATVAVSAASASRIA